MTHQEPANMTNPFPSGKVRFFGRSLGEDAVALAVFSLYVFLVYRGFYLHDNLPAHDPMVLYYLNFFQMVRDWTLANGEIMQWFYCQLMGYDFLGQEPVANAMVLSNLIFLLPFDVNTIHVVGTNLVLVVFGYLCYGFLRSLGFSLWAVYPAVALAMAPVGWASNSILLGVFMSAGVALLPLCLFLLRNLVITEGRSWSNLAGLCLVLALMYLLSGAMLSYMSFKLFGPYLIYLVVVRALHHRRQGQGAMRFLGRLALSLGLVGMVTFLLCGYQILPFLDNMAGGGYREGHHIAALSIWEIISPLSVLPHNLDLMAGQTYLVQAHTVVQDFFDLLGLKWQSHRQHLYLGIVLLPLLWVGLRRRLFTMETAIFPALLLFYWFSFTSWGSFLALEQVFKGIPMQNLPVISLRLCAAVVVATVLHWGLSHTDPARLKSALRDRGLWIIGGVLVLGLVLLAGLFLYARKGALPNLYLWGPLVNTDNYFNLRLAGYHFFQGPVFWAVLAGCAARIIQLLLVMSGAAFRPVGIVVITALIMWGGGITPIYDNWFNSPFYREWSELHQKSELAAYIEANASRFDRIGVHYAGLNMFPSLLATAPDAGSKKWLTTPQHELLKEFEGRNRYEFSYSGSAGLLYDVPFLFGKGYSFYNLHVGLLPDHFIDFNRAMFNGKRAYFYDSWIGFNAFSPLTRYTAVRYVVAVPSREIGLDALEQRARSHGYQVVRRFELDGTLTVSLLRSNYPYAYVAGSVSGPMANADALAAMARAPAGHWDRAFASAEGMPGFMGFDGGQASKVASVDRTAMEVTVRTTSQRPGMLVISEMYSPWWRARMAGGDELHVQRVNVTAMGVTLPAGSHEVVFSYSNQRLLTGGWLTLAGGCLTALMFVLALLPGKRRQQAPASAPAQAPRARQTSAKKE